MSGDSLGFGDATQSSGPSDRPPLSKDVFVSYASQDVAVANAVVEVLEKQGIRCWIAPRDVTPGEFYADAIVHAIDAAQALVLVLSQHAAVSHHILREVERASSKRHPVISLRIDRAALPAGLEYFLNTSQWLDASEGEPSRVFPKLVEAVRKTLAGGSSVEAHPVPSLHSHVLAPSPSRRSLGRPVAVVLGLIFVAACGVVAYTLSRHVAEEKPVTAMAATTPVSASAIPEKSVAVLPFVDMSEKKDQEYFSDGLSEELIDMLAKVSDLRVPARTSSFYFKGKQATITDIAKALGVSHVLEGSVRKSGDNLRITAQLIRVDNGYHVWSETYDRKVDDIFKIQDEISVAVVRALKISLLKEVLSRPAPTSNSDAYGLYLRADFMMRRAAKADIENSINDLTRAVELDPSFAAAWAELSRDLLVEAQYHYVPYSTVRERARAAAERAVTLDPTLAAAQIALGKVRMFLDLDWERADAAFRKAIELQPEYADGYRWGGVSARDQGRSTEALQLMTRAADLDPLYYNNFEMLSSIYYVLGRWTDAETAMRTAITLKPDIDGSHAFLADLFFRQSKRQAALDELQREPDQEARLSYSSIIYHWMGRSADADAALARFVEQYGQKFPADLASIYACRGEGDRAFTELDRAARNDLLTLTGLKTDPCLSGLKGDPRYAKLLKTVKLLE